MFLSRSSHFLNRALVSTAAAKSPRSSSASSLLGRHRHCLFSTSGFSGEDEGNDGDSIFPVGQAIVGQVKSWNREKCYGHIKPENAPPGTPDVFVHRSGIVSDLPHDKFPSNPFLRQGERVQFKVEQKGEGKFSAVEVTFANGHNIPPLRHTFFLGRIERARDRSARSLVEALQNGTAMSPDMTVEQKAALFDQFVSLYSREIDNAVKVITMVGMSVDDFPQNEEEFKATKRNNNKASKNNQNNNNQQSGSSTDADAESDPLEALMKSLDDTTKN